MPTMLNFKYGLHQNLPAYDSSKVGSIYVTTDEQAMYVDLPAGRIRVSQLITLSGVSEWERLTPPYSTEAFYYIADANALLKYNGTDWVQINSTKAITDALANLEASINNQLESFSTRLDSYDTTINSLNTDVSQLKTNVQTAQGTINNHDTRLDTAEENIKKLQDDLAQEINAKIATNVEGIAANKAAIEQEVKDRQEALQQLEQKIEQNGTNLSDLQKAIDNEVSVREEADIALSDRITTNTDNIATNTENIASHKASLDNEVKRSTDEDVRLAGLIAANTTNISTNKTAIETEASERQAADAELKGAIEKEISDREQAVQELTKTVTNNMQAADAMKFMGTVSSSAELLGKEAGAEVGHTYKAVGEFMDGDVVTISFANDDHKVYVGDLLIASGEETDGVITGDVTWLHVPSGYTADYNPEMSVVANGDNKATISLTSGAADGTGDLGTVTFEAAADSCVAVSSDGAGVVIGMAWGTF